jgi:hypothetical protein
VAADTKYSALSIPQNFSRIVARDAWGKIRSGKDMIHQNWNFDVAIGIGTAENLPKKIADRYVDILTSLAPVTVFTAAPPSQEEADHVNLQPKNTGYQKNTGFEALSQRTAKNWKDARDVEPWYYQNPMISRRSHV